MKPSALFLPLLALLAVPLPALASHGVPLVNMSQRDPANGNATVASGGNITGTQIGFQVSSDDLTCGSSYAHQVQFEVVPANSSFTGNPTFSSSWYQGFKPDCIVKAYPQQNYTVPTTAGEWKWRVRERTSSNGGSSISSTGSWTDFGGASGVDFTTNDLPIAEANGPYTGGQGTAIALNATGSNDPDGSISLYEWDCTSDGSYDVSGSSPTGLTCTYIDDGVFTATLRVTDNEGGQDTDTATVTVTNAPPVAEANGPYAGTKGFPIPISAVGSGDSDGSIVGYQWDCTTDGVYEISTGAPVGNACQYSAVGTYTITLRVTDDDGAQVTDTATVTVGNDPPTADAGGPYAGDEGSAIVLDGSGSSDVGGGSIVSWEWDCTDDGVYDVVANTATGNACTYTDEGGFTVRLRVTDDDGATAEDTAAVAISNVAPTVSSVSGPTTGDEGSALSFSVTTSDPGADTLTTTWAWDDATADSNGDSVSHTYVDEGVYDVLVTVDDGDGGTVTTTTTVTVANVAPTIDTTAPATADEAVQWSYAPTATEPGADTLTWSVSASAPSGLSIDSATGAMTWTPTYADALASPLSWTLTVDDGDGGTDTEGITVAVTTADDDADGLADGWELANGLDPSDPSDAAGDPDADGLTNLDEFTGGTDPNVFDGPDAPVLVEPIAAEETTSTAPDLVWDNATDPNGDVLTYDVEVYSDAGLTTLVTSATGLAEDPSGTTEWKVDVSLMENGTYWWRVRAADPYVEGAWALEESFFVNEVNEEPAAPVLTTPIEGAIAASLTPLLQWSEATDPDGDTLTYDVEVYDATGTLVTSTVDVAGDGLVAEWMVDTDLVEDAVYTWTVRAVDEHGLAGAWAVEEPFLVSTANAAPTDTVFLEPTDGASLTNLPVLVASESIDPEGGVLRYHFEVDSASSFDSGDYADALVDATGTGEVEWDLVAAGVSLPENATIYARVRAEDDGGVTSNPDTISFFVRGDNDAPDVPTLLAPEDGTSGGAGPTFEVSVPVDPEGDVVYIDIVVASDEALEEVIAETTGIVGAGGTVTWSPGVNLEGTVYWSARAVDAFDAASEWAVPFSYEAPPGEVTGDDDDDDDDDDDGEGGCDCASSVADANGASWALLLALVPVVMRRRR